MTYREREAVVPQHAAVPNGPRARRGAVGRRDIAVLPVAVAGRYVVLTNTCAGRVDPLPIHEVIHS